MGFFSGGSGGSGFVFERFPSGLSFFQFGVIEPKRFENAGGHQFVAIGVHVDAIGGEHVFTGSVELFDSVLELGVQVREGQLFLGSKFAKEVVIRREFGILWRAEVLFDDGCGEDDGASSGGGGLVDDLRDIFFVGAFLRLVWAGGESSCCCGCVVERDAVGSVPDVIDAAAESHPLGLLAEDIFFESGEHLVGFVATDAGGDGFGFDAVGFETGDDEAHIAGGVTPSALGDGIAEERDFFA